MLIHTTARIRFQVQSRNFGFGKWLMVFGGTQTRSPGWKSGVTLHSTLTSTPLDTFSLRKVYCSSSSVQVIWKSADGFGLQVHPCLVPKGTPPASGWGSWQNDMRAAVERRGRVFLLGHSAQRWRPAQKRGSVSGLHLLLSPKRCKATSIQELQQERACVHIAVTQWGGKINNEAEVHRNKLSGRLIYGPQPWFQLCRRPRSCFRLHSGIDPASGSPFGSPSSLRANLDHGKAVRSDITVPTGPEACTAPVMRT